MAELHDRNARNLHRGAESPARVNRDLENGVRGAREKRLTRLMNIVALGEKFTCTEKLWKLPIRPFSISIALSYVSYQFLSDVIVMKELDASSNVK